VEKYQLLMAKAKETSLLANFELFEPQPATAADLFLVHLPDYVKDFMNFEYTEATITSELPLNEAIRDFFLLTTGGTIKAAELSLERGAAFNIGGGWHHAFPDHAEGFCYLNDVAIAIRKMQQEKKQKSLPLLTVTYIKVTEPPLSFKETLMFLPFLCTKKIFIPLSKKAA
jgi:acetoin utilization deacetylase AcuC-like enzyme